MPESLAGQTLAEKYLVEGVLGDGGMSTVVAARHLALGDRVAIKLLRADLAENDYVVSRFLREGRISARLRSRHVVNVRDVGRLDDGVPFMVMDLLEGENLEQRLKHDKPLPVELAVDLTLQACDALAEAHAAGIVHRDIKPGNLFLTAEQGRTVLKVFDFGISKVVEDDVDESHRTSAQEIFGSPFYMSPEQLLSSTDVDSRADVWSLGVVLYEMLTGTLPFQADVLAKLHLAVLQGDPTDIRAHAVDLPEGLAEVVHRCLARERDDRWPTMHALAEALEPYASDHGRAALVSLRNTPPPASEARIPTRESQRPSLSSTSERAIAVPTGQSAHKTLTPWAGKQELSQRRKTGAIVGFLIGASVLTGVFLLSRGSDNKTSPAPASAPPPALDALPVTPQPHASAPAAPSASASAPAPVAATPEAHPGDSSDRLKPAKRSGGRKADSAAPAAPPTALPDDRY